ncbi:Ig-like domain (group 3) [Sulfitobacter marinus]|uniref:Ig-like domain (Group 3) n=1 Tax=Sulfitobacter marinus TaxID=394264 RepID=A0A1I6PCM6_9RHOB|nr:Ig-like domain-containing protein [Sulfitobacter marinus]SFS37900.1 Ig-like domain (group 3) [Sulfitobacter marinus]
MKTIEFVIRDQAGAVQRGILAEGATSYIIPAQVGQEISLNLRQADFLSHQRDGNDLVLTLVDGTVITIDSYFNDTGSPNRLFISSDGYLNEVGLVAVEGNNLHAQYGPTEQWGKWSPSDDLIYFGRTDTATITGAMMGEENEVSMLAAPLLGAGMIGGGGAVTAAAVAGGAAILGGGANAGDAVAVPTATTTPTSPSAPTPAPTPEIAISLATGGRNGKATITGMGTPGATIDITVEGTTQTTTVDADGTWSVSYDAGSFRDGEYQTQITATLTDQNGNTATSADTLTVDTLVNELTFANQAGAADATINTAEAAQGVTLTGSVEAGSTVSVAMGAVTLDAAVDPDGNWSATFAPGDIPAGTYASAIVATATDKAGNTRSITQSVWVDTEAGALTISAAPVESDDVINAAEASDGVAISGTADAGAVVTVTLAGVVTTTRADQNGEWTSHYTAGDVAQGVYTAEITARVTDGAGNTRTETDSVRVDTRVDNLSLNKIEGDNTVNGVERLADGGVMVSGTSETGSSVAVKLGNASANGVVDAVGNWSVAFAPGQVPEGTYNTTAVVTATDGAGNTATASWPVLIDTVVDTLNLNTPGGTDAVVSAREAAAGIDLAGQVEAGSRVVVRFDGTNYTATVDASGNWDVTIPPENIRSGTYQADISIKATDHVGNVDTLSYTVAIDTYAPDGPVIESYTRDGDGIRAISVEQSDDALAVHQIQADKSITEVAASTLENDTRNETNFYFDSTVPDGSDLIVTATDAAGNSSGTYLALDDESANTLLELTNPNLASHNIETIDLQFAEEAQLSITEAALLNLSSNTNTLIVNGHADDTVTIRGGTRTGTEVKEGQTYDIYMLGSEGTLMIDDDISVIV